MDELLDKLTAQISVYSGRKVGGLAALQDLIHRMESEERTVCECCGGEGYRGRTPWHKDDCPIVKKYKTVFGGS